MYVNTECESWKKILSWRLFKKYEITNIIR